MEKKTTTKKATKKKVKQEPLSDEQMKEIEDGKDLNIKVKPKKKSILPGVVFIIIMIILFITS